MYDEVDFERDCELAAIGQAIIEDTASWCGLPESASIGEIEKAIYRGTCCGAYIHFTEFGVVIGSIVEGSDAEFNYEYRVGPEYTREHYHTWLDDTFEKLEVEVDDEWQNMNQEF